MKRYIACALLCCLVLTLGTACGEAGAVYRLVDEQGQFLTTLGCEMEPGDEYISGDNQIYKIVSVADGQAVAKHMGAFAMPDVSWLEEDVVATSANGRARKLALYCTHSDESYTPTDGVSSDEDRGGIYDVAAALKTGLEERNIQVALSDATHHPHDAGAYRRSRQTAIQLLKSGPDAIFDLHRDGIPDPEEYTLTLGGKNASKIRLLVGKSNQNASANKAFATQIKAVADKIYPGLIKDIFIGKGTYNQDLSPRSVLLECGTHTISKERVLNSMTAMAQVIDRTMYGGVTGAAGVSDVTGTSREEGAPASESSQGASSGIWWILGIFVAGLIVYAVIATGTRQGAAQKLKREVSEMTGGLLGKKPKDDA